MPPSSLVFLFVPEPMHFKATPQAHPCAMQHYPTFFAESTCAKCALFLGLGSFQIGGRDFPVLQPVMVRQFVAQDAKEPGTFGGASGKACTGPERGQECLLNQILRHGAVPYARRGEPEQSIPIFLDPALWIQPGQLSSVMRLDARFLGECRANHKYFRSTVSPPDVASR